MLKKHKFGILRIWEDGVGGTELGSPVLVTGSDSSSRWYDHIPVEFCLLAYPALNPSKTIENRWEIISNAKKHSNTDRVENIDIL